LAFFLPVRTSAEDQAWGNPETPLCLKEKKGRYNVNQKKFKKNPNPPQNHLPVSIQIASTESFRLMCGVMSDLHGGHRNYN